MIKKKSLSLVPAVFAGIILAGLIMGLTLWFQPTSLMAMLRSMLHQPLILVMNYLPIALVLAVFAFLFNNVFHGAALTALIWGGLSLGNRVKSEVRDDPLYPRDFGLLKEAADAAGSYEMDLPWGLAAILLAFIILFIFLGSRFPCKKSAAPKRKRFLTRLVCAAVSFAITLCAIFFVYSSDDLYNSFTVSNRYHITAVYNDLGFPYCFFYNFTTYEVMEPEGFDKKEAAEYEAAATSETSGGNAHVIMIMSEAFSDVTDRDVFTFTEENDPLKNFHALATEENSISGHIAVPTYAGGTANTEYDVLTGMMTTNLNTTSAFRSFNRDLDSLFRVYGANGYRTLYMHPGDSWFYNRENCMKLLGADESLFAADMDCTYKGGWVTDDSVADNIISQFEASVAADEYFFTYTTTIQNHMSYTYAKYGEDYQFPPISCSADLSAEAREMLEVYVEGQRDADAMLLKLTDYFSATDEPVVLVFFGDHLPYLGDGSLAYRELGLDPANESGMNDAFTYYSTPYLIWSNDAAAETLDLAEKKTALELPADGLINANYLGSVVLELTDHAEESAFFAYLSEMRREIPALRHENCRTADGSNLTEIPEELQPLVDKLKNWSYYKLKFNK